MMARSPYQSAEGSPAAVMLVCPKCHWQAAAPENWVAPFAVCPRCESRIANPDASRSPQPGGRSRGKAKPQKMPTGYQFTYSEHARRRNDAWIKNFMIIGFGIFAIAGTFWAIGKRRANTKPRASQSVYQLSDDAVGGAAVTPNLGEGIPEEPIDIPSGSLEWSNDYVFSAPLPTADESGDSLWDATGIPDDTPLAPPSTGDFRDPSMPSLDGFK